MAGLYFEEALLKSGWATGKLTRKASPRRWERKDG
jgi:hypothetical protein